MIQMIIKTLIYVLLEALHPHFISQTSKDVYTFQMVINTAQIHLANPELRFYPSLDPVRGVSEIHDADDL